MSKSIGRLSLKFLADVVLWVLAAPIAFMLRLPMEVWPQYVGAALLYTQLTLPVKGILVYAFGLYRQIWRRVAIWDLFTLIKAIGLATLLFASALLIVFPLPNEIVIPRSIPLLDGMLALLVLGGARFAWRLYFVWNASRRNGHKQRRVLIVTEGDAGVLVAESMRQFPQTMMKPVGLLDEDTSKHHMYFGGLPVFGGIEELPEVVVRYHVNEVIIAMPSASGSTVRRVFELAHQAGVRCRIVPQAYEATNGFLSISEIRDVRIEDLLRREPAHLDLGDIADYLNERTVMITGAGGSIGSELTRQVARFRPAAVLLVGRGENSLVEIQRELEYRFPDLHAPAIIVDIQNRRKLDYIFRTYRPDIVFNTAAHKHVPLMELNPDEAVLNNIGGIKNLVDLALAYDVKHFVNISTDKAVNPTSIMGATKRVTELLVAQAGRKARPDQVYVSVRFGNVLGSRGSVIPLFKQQIQMGGPVTVTHPNMTRYFMTIPEAVQLTLQAAAHGKSGEIYVLDMGEPVKIVDLARDMIRLSGLEPGVDIDIVYTGIRPGERLAEELLSFEEGVTATKHNKIFVANHQNTYDEEVFNSTLEELFEAARAQDTAGIHAILKTLVGTYRPREAMSGWEESCKPSLVTNQADTRL
jgi:FlaA1/EpsC-like NDP-sugar epimerase